MAVKTPAGFIDFSHFMKITSQHYTYESAAQERAGKIYDLIHDGKKWNCNCPDASRRERNIGVNDCKHRQALKFIINEKINASASNRQAQAVVEHVEESTELAALRAEIEELRAQRQDEIAAIRVENTELRAELAEIKRVLATKATARRKHALETESAEIKRDMNLLAEDVIEAANNAIQTVGILKERLADLESIPHELKAELDSWTENGREELQPDYKAPEPAPEIKKALRDAQESERARRQQTERKEKAPLNSNSGFNFYK